MKPTLYVLSTLFVLAVGFLVFPFTGLYNVAATEGHTPFARWYLDTTSERSIAVRADDISVPINIVDPEVIAAGAVEYAAMCQQCHGAPGQERGVFGKGMTPTPPRLSEAMEEWEPYEVYWILEHGIKMAGMPAFGPTHSDEELWNVVAFVHQLPEMTPDEYTALVESHEPAAGNGHAETSAADHDAHEAH